MNPRDYPMQENDDLCPDIASKAYTSKFARESDTPPSICVVEAVAEAIETDPKDLQPLYESIDPDALNILLESPHQFNRGCITFRFAGCNVTVSTDEWIAVLPRVND
ncbi:HalOD1 output domain-containing protein [Halorubrum sp. CBA1125]|uniref:HalOD1 output domain-containing protein n=1 Tax=Halorubrum sp. CBA1125 TaxID=2668072 RepID=UPI002AA2B511|nr:HalOD1 output domain-containing protein [Halorubrum sp. CBA1125]